MEKLFITTSQGVYLLNQDETEAKLCLKREKGLLFFKKGGFGFFGLDQYKSDVLVASRENFSKQRLAKHSEDVRLYKIDAETLQTSHFADIHGVADVHQIAIFEDLCFLTDTGHNLVTVFNLAQKKIATEILVGDERADINHINAVTVHSGTIYIGLNNRGKQDSQVLSIPFSKIDMDKQVNRAYEIAEIIELKGLTHTHDFELFNNDWLVCASHQGAVYKAQPTAKACEPGSWVRGLVESSKGLWIGMSAKLDRKNRHREDVDGDLSLWSPDFSSELRRVQLSNAGQVNDLLILR